MSPGHLLKTRTRCMGTAIQKGISAPDLCTVQLILMVLMQEKETTPPKSVTTDNMSVHGSELPQKRNHTLNAKLISKDNVHQDAIKHRKLMAKSTSSQLTQLTAKLMLHRSCSASVEVVDDQDNLYHHNAGTPRDPNTILESVYDDQWETLMDRGRRKASATTKGKEKLQDPKGKPKPKPKQQHACSGSVEEVDDKDNVFHKNAGRPRDPNTILESVDDNDNVSPVEHAPKKKVTTSGKSSWKSAPKVVENEGGLQEDADKAKLS